MRRCGHSDIGRERPPLARFSLLTAPGLRRRRSAEGARPGETLASASVGCPVRQQGSCRASGCQSPGEMSSNAASAYIWRKLLTVLESVSLSRRCDPCAARAAGSDRATGARAPRPIHARETDQRPAMRAAVATMRELRRASSGILVLDGDHGPARRVDYAKRISFALPCRADGGRGTRAAEASRSIATDVPPFSPA